MSIKRATSAGKDKTIVILANGKTKFTSYGLTTSEANYVTTKLKVEENDSVVLNRLGSYVVIPRIKPHKEVHIQTENYRKAGHGACGFLNKKKITDVWVVDTLGNSTNTLAFAEGLALGNYQFLKYFKDARKRQNTLKAINLVADATAKQVSQLKAVCDAVYEARTLVNEPWSYLNAVQISKEFQRMGKAAGFKVEVMNKKKIQSLKMGGLLAVNQGSVDPPTFTIMEWNPKNAKNKKPYVLVGKGVVYDTGGLSLKPTPNSMDQMKCDMGGAAAVGGAIYAVAKAKLPVHVIALVPATDNRPGGNAYTPGDVVKMHNGITVEVLNTDAEGRMILADALSYAKRYNPALVMDAATLTGAAARAFGQYGICAMGNAIDKQWDRLKQSGNTVYERIIEQPFWEEYGELIKSQIADIKNIGGAEAGAITAGKFLEHFTDYNWIHLDIAGPAYLMKEDNYRGKGGTAVGVRLLFDFFKNS